MSPCPPPQSFFTILPPSDAEHGNCSFRFKIIVFIYLSIIQVTFFLAKPSRFPTVSRVKLISFGQTTPPAAAVCPGTTAACRAANANQRAGRRGAGPAGAARTQARTDRSVARLPRKANFRSFGCAQMSFCIDKDISIKLSMLQRIPHNAFSDQLSKHKSVAPP